MKYIRKNNPPQSLVTYRKKTGASYEDLVNNHRDIYEETRLSLADEQGYICCYCGRRINGFQGTQIEHLFPKKTEAYNKMQLDYETNLLATCDGGKYKRKQDPSIPKDQLFCDTKKDNETIPVTPLNPLCEEKFLYDQDGNVLGVSGDAEATIAILNLNSPILKNMRKSAIENYTLLPPEDWYTEYERLKHRNANGAYEEFCFVLQSYIECFHSQELNEQHSEAV